MLFCSLLTVNYFRRLSSILDVALAITDRELNQRRKTELSIGLNKFMFLMGLYSRSFGMKHRATLIKESDRAVIPEKSIISITSSNALNFTFILLVDIKHVWLVRLVSHPARSISRVGMVGELEAS